MNISALISSNNAASSSALLSLLGGSGDTSSSSSTSSTSAASSAVTEAIAAAETRVQKTQSATTAQLSAFGLLQSSLAEVQTSAQAVTGLSSSSSGSDITQAMGTLFNDFNSVIASSASTAALPGSGQGAVAAKQVSREMTWALNASPAVQDAMQTLGITVQSDGSLAQNATTFAAAVQSDPTTAISAMNTLAQAINSASTNALGSSGAMASTVSGLTQQNTNLTNQQRALQTMETALGITLPTSSAAGTGSSSSSSSAADSSALSSDAGASSSSSAESALANSLLSSASSTLLDYGLSAYQANSSSSSSNI